MNTCKAVQRDIEALAGLPPADLPEWARSHVATCAACNRRLAVARLAREMVAAGAETIAPPRGFADRVVAALPARAGRRHPETATWRPAWGLVPTFAAAAAALCILYQTSDGSGPIGLLSTEGLSAGESLVLGSSAPDLDAVLDALMEGGAQ